MDFLEIDKANLIWFLTFLIGISLLIYINIGFSDKWIRIIQNAFLVLLTLILSFVVGFLEEKIELTKTLSELASIGTPLIALFAYWEYKSKTANKVNEKQLDEIINLFKKLNENITVISFQHSPYNASNGTHSSIENLDQGLILLSKKFQEVNKYPIVKDDRSLNINYKNIFFTEAFITNLRCIINYEKNVLIPKKTSNILSDLTLPQEIIDRVNRKNKDSIKINSPYTIEVTDENYIKKEKSLYPFVVVGLKDEMENLEKLRETLLNSCKSPKPFTLPEELIPISIICTYFLNDSVSTYNDWLTFRKKLNEMVKSLAEWLHDNNVKGINLPELDHTNAQSKESQ